MLLCGVLMSFNEPLMENDSKVRLYFLHERAFFGHEVEITINHKLLTPLPSNKYFFVDVEAGNLNIIISGKDKFMEDAEANISLEPNQVYYLKIYREIDYFTNKLYLVRVSEQTAKKAMKSMKLESPAPTILKNE